MLLTATLLLTLSASAEADLSLAAAHLRDGIALAQLAERAGNRSAYVRPERWRDDWAAILATSLSDASALTALGLDADAPLSLTVRGETRITCVGLRDAPAFVAAVTARLAKGGDVERDLRGGVERIFVRRSDKAAVVGVVRKSDRACLALVKAPGATLDAALKALGASVAGVSDGTVRIRTPAGAGTLRAAGDTLLFEGTSTRRSALVAQGPLLPLPQGGPLAATMRLRPEAIASRAARFLSDAAPSGAAAHISAFIAQLARASTGRVAFRLHEVKRGAPLATPAERMAAVLGGVEIELTSAAALPMAAVATSEGGRWKLPLTRSTLWLLQQGSRLRMANSPDALDALAQAKPDAAPASLHFHAEGKLAARALSAVSFLELLRSPDLAPLVLVTTELGPLLEVTDALDLHVSATPSGTRVSGHWRLLPP